MQTKRVAIILSALMCCVSAAGVVIRPPDRTASKPHLEQNVPKEFAGWKEIPEPGVVSDPVADELLRKLYGEILARSYVNSDGYRIMLSIAWGANQTGNLQAHLPEVCYRAQGFDVLPTDKGKLGTAFGTIAVVKLDATKGPRHEPITYWLTNGNKIVRNGIDRRIVQIMMMLNGTIPDGMLLRVSSIDASNDRAFAIQQHFASDLLANVSPELRRRLSGLSAPVVATSGGTR